MPNNLLVVDKCCFSSLTRVFFNLTRYEMISSVQMIKITDMSLTMGNHPTTWPPPIPSPLRMSTGRLAMRAITGYPFSVPKEDNCVLSA